MDTHLALLGVLLLVLAYLVGIRKQTWLLTGFNQHRVKDKKRLAKITGSFLFFPLAILMLISSVIHYPYKSEILLTLMIGSVVIAISYVNSRMVE
ncbi:DUF3784 domain-containing protein [Melghirimyces algeriensis]|uniref:DUF3784 domain-containing protein n=1 Tax=Melghirimyces algeriensis TaxID=910412 RepID=A0A521DFD9_9BACL|nr:DUF3784 domain-containing protein [Melghirimyces algeriensis]SMO69851.1 protein of unknown function [Melghirimyces algeriensis]